VFGDSRYEFKPMWFDLDKRLGLHPLGLVFSLFMWTTLLYQIGVFLLRLGLIYANGQGPFSDWLTKVVQSVKKSDNILYVLFSPDLYQFDTLDSGAYIALFAMIIPMVIISYFPLSLHRNCIAKERGLYATAQMRAYDDLVVAGRTKDGKQLKRKIYAAREANIWPNGTSTATRFFAVMGVLLLAT